MLGRASSTLYHPTAKLAPPHLATYFPPKSQSGENFCGSVAASATTSRASFRLSSIGAAENSIYPRFGLCAASLAKFGNHRGTRIWGNVTAFSRIEQVRFGRETFFLANVVVRGVAKIARIVASDKRKRAADAQILANAGHAPCFPPAQFGWVVAQNPPMQAVTGFPQQSLPVVHFSPTSEHLPTGGCTHE